MSPGQSRIKNRRYILDGKKQCGTQHSEELFCSNELFIYLWLCWVFVAVCGLSLVLASWGCSLAAVCRLLIAVAALVAEHRLSDARASVAVACGLRS